MNFGDLQLFFEGRTPDGIGFAFSSDFVGGAITTALRAISGGISSNVPIANEPRVQFSFAIDPTKFLINTDFEVSFNVDVWLHPSGKPADRIVTLSYTISQVALAILYNQQTGLLYWGSPPDVSAQLGNYQLNDQYLIEAGFTLPDGSADEATFLNKVLYGFIWVTSSNLIDSIFRNIPFPQLQKWTVDFIMQPPFETDMSGGYAKVWSDTVIDVFTNCGSSPRPSTPPSYQVVVAGGVPGSPQDASSPPFALYIGAKNLVRWQAHGYAPGVTASGSGGAFIKWSIDMSVSVQSLTLTLQPAPNGGGLAIHADLGALAIAQAWVDGPCGSQLSLLQLTAKGSGTFDGSEDVAFVYPPGRIDLDSSIKVSLDQGSLQTGFGGAAWPFGPVENMIIGWAITSGTINLNARYSDSSEMRLIDFSQLNVLSKSTVFKRVGISSVLVGFLADLEGQ